MKVKIDGVRTVRINGEYIKLDALLKYASVVSTGGEAKVIISEGQVLLGGEPVYERGRKIRPGDIVTARGEALRIASKGL